MAKKSRKNTEVIHDAWLMGFMQSHRGATVADAVAYWMEQTRLAASWEAEQAASSDPS